MAHWWETADVEGCYLPSETDNREGRRHPSLESQEKTSQKLMFWNFVLKGEWEFIRQTSFVKGNSFLIKVKWGLENVKWHVDEDVLSSSGVWKDKKGGRPLTGAVMRLQNLSTCRFFSSLDTGFKYFLFCHWNAFLLVCLAYCP